MGLFLVGGFLGIWPFLKKFQEKTSIFDRGSGQIFKTCLRFEDPLEVRESRTFGRSSARNGSKTTRFWRILRSPKIGDLKFGQNQSKMVDFWANGRYF